MNGPKIAALGGKCLLDHAVLFGAIKNSEMACHFGDMANFDLIVFREIRINHTSVRNSTTMSSSSNIKSGSAYL